MEGSPAWFGVYIFFFYPSYQVKTRQLIDPLFCGPPSVEPTGQNGNEMIKKTVHHAFQWHCPQITVDMLFIFFAHEKCPLVFSKLLKKNCLFIYGLIVLLR